MKFMQKVLGQMRRAIEDFSLIQNGDRICVGVSGGKDSVLLLYELKRLQAFLPVDFSLVAVTLDPNFGGQSTDYTPIAQMCEQIGVEYVVKRTQIGQIIFDIRKETNPCSLCARIRRGCLHDTAKELGCNVIALGHHNDDVLETFIMNLFQEGRLGCFSPKTYLSRKDLTMIRPMVFLEERDISGAVRKLGLPVVKSVCPVDGQTNREKTKQFIAGLEKNNRGLKKRMFGALRRSGLDGWGFAQK